tara:strand:+ start:517 stop:2268 length:1752 start_codon:yes stop_codon:yes gene_type:complete
MYQNIINILLTIDKKRFFLLVFFLILLALIEIISLGLVIPLITAIIDYESIQQTPKLFAFLNFIENLDFLSPDLEKRQKVILIITMGIIIFFILKFIFVIFVAWYQSTIDVHLNYVLSSKILKKYVYSNYSFHVKKNSSELISTLNEEINEVTLCIRSFIRLISEVFLVIGIVILLFFVIKIWSFYAGILIFIFAALIRSIGANKLHKLGHQRQFHNKSKLESLKNIFGSIKEIKILRKETFFLNIFNFHNLALNKTAVFRSIIKVVPRLSLEFIGVILILSLTIIWVISGLSSEKIIYNVGIMAVCAFRLFPATSSILVSLHQIKFNTAAIKKVSEDLEISSPISKKQNNDVEEYEFKKKISLKIKNFYHDDKHSFRLKNINLEIPKNKFIGIYGPSGSGKSTLIDILTGIIQLDNKENILEVDNKKINTNNNSWKNKFGYIGQNIFLLNDTIKKNVAFGISEEQINNEKVLSSLKKAEIYDFINSLDHNEETILNENGLNFSGGQRQRIGISRLFYLDPEILIFDEATSSLDKKVEDDILKTIFKLKGLKTILMISHKIENLSNCDLFYEVKKGEVIKHES